MTAASRYGIDGPGNSIKLVEIIHMYARLNYQYTNNFTIFSWFIHEKQKLFEPSFVAHHTYGSRSVRCLQFNDELIAAGYFGGEICLWDIQTAELVLIFYYFYYFSAFLYYFVFNRCMCLTTTSTVLPHITFLLIV